MKVAVTITVAGKSQFLEMKIDSLKDAKKILTTLKAEIYKRLKNLDKLSS